MEFIPNSPSPPSGTTCSLRSAINSIVLRKPVTVYSIPDFLPFGGGCLLVVNWSHAKEHLVFGDSLPGCAGVRRQLTHNPGPRRIHRGSDRGCIHRAVLRKLPSRARRRP